MERLSVRIQAYRKFKGLSLRDLARKSGVTVTTLSRIEHGCDTTISTIVKIEAALGQSLF